MKKIKLITATLFLVLTVSSFGQTSKKKNYFPVWTYHMNNINIHGISIGLGSVNGKPRYTNTNGIKLELIGMGVLLPLAGSSPIPDSDSAFIKLSKNPFSEKINGLNLSATGTICNCLTNGVSAGLIGQVNYQVNGISTSLFINITQKQNGIMASIFNDAYYMNGLQIGIGNSGSKIKGVQVGFILNKAKKMDGVQIGLINKSENLRGIQIGLWNVNQKRKLPFINWNFKR